MLIRNPRVTTLNAGYLFPEVAKRRAQFEQANPGPRIINLGIGNTTRPLPPHITEGLVAGAAALGTAAGYSGYQDEGREDLRARINDVCYNGAFDLDEIFISDGAKCDIARLQVLFGAMPPVAVQDPSYPVYVDGSVLVGATGPWNGRGYDGITYLACTGENNYYPDFDEVQNGSIIYFCSPNNPTGAVSTIHDLNDLVDVTLNTSSLIVFDASYGEYIRDQNLPRSIYAADNARHCAIEVNSFSKFAGFTGVRLGWVVIPKEITYMCGTRINQDFHRVVSTIFNGASNIAQAGGLAALDPEGLQEVHSYVEYYRVNALTIRRTLEKLGVTCSGGTNSPYVWAHFPAWDSWELFTQVLTKCRIVTTPGVGFGPSGQSYLRFSGFGSHEDTLEACERIQLNGIGAYHAA